MAQLYSCAHLEAKYCAELCPIGQSRKQLQYDNIKEVTLSLSASLDYLKDNAKLIGRCIRDDYISDQEWPDMLATLQILKDISHRAKFIWRWSGFSPQCIHDDTPEQIRIKKAVNPYAEVGKERIVLQSGKEKSMTQETAAAQTDITRSTLASIESNKILPTQSQVIRMSKAYLFPKIRNFYCYHDCPIGGRQDPLNICDSRGVICMFLSLLLYVGDLNRQLRRLLSDGEIQEHEQKEFRNALNELMDLSSQADTMVLNMVQQLCGKLKAIVADGLVTAAERAEFVKTIDYLERLGYWPEHLEELKEIYF